MSEAESAPLAGAFTQPSRGREPERRPLVREPNYLRPPEPPVKKGVCVRSLIRVPEQPAARRLAPPAGRRPNAVSPGDQVESFRNGPRGGVPPSPRAQRQRLAPDSALLPGRPEGIPGVSHVRPRAGEGQCAPVSRPSRRSRIPVALVRARRQPGHRGAQIGVPALVLPPPGPPGDGDEQPRGDGRDAEAGQTAPPCPERA